MISKTAKPVLKCLVKHYRRFKTLIIIQGNMRLWRHSWILDRIRPQTPTEIRIPNTPNMCQSAPKPAESYYF